jgi:hypothetical protein
MSESLDALEKPGPPVRRRGAIGSTNHPAELVALAL